VTLTIGNVAAATLPRLWIRNTACTSACPCTTFLVHGRQHALEGLVDVVNQVVNDRVLAHVDTILCRQPARRLIDIHMKADHDRP
jgi:hypothetical protein